MIRAIEHIDKGMVVENAEGKGSEQVKRDQNRGER